MDYHIFKRTRYNKGKKIKVWSYWYFDGEKQISRVCPHCKSKIEAENFIQNLEPLEKKKSSLVLKDVSSTMYLLGSSHMLRREQMGKTLAPGTIEKSRKFIKDINSYWGNEDLKSISVKKVIDYLIEDKITKNHDGTYRVHSNSWKNEYLMVFKEIFKEAVYQGVISEIPIFPRFKLQGKKADIFSTEEINSLFKPENFSNETLFLFFLLTFTAGLRLGETRGIRRSQFLLQYNTLVIDGFIRSDGIRTSFNKRGTPDDPKTRWCLIPDEILSLIITYCDKNNIKNDDYIFQKDGRPLRKSYAEACFKRAIEKAGIRSGKRKLVPHSLRYTYVTRMRRDLPAEIVAKIVGHSSTSMTNYYTRPNNEEGVRAILSSQESVQKLFT